MNYVVRSPGADGLHHVKLLPGESIRQKKNV